MGPRRATPRPARSAISSSGAGRWGPEPPPAVMGRRPCTERGTPATRRSVEKHGRDSANGYSTLHADARNDLNRAGAARDPGAGPGPRVPTIDAARAAMIAVRHGAPAPRQGQ